VSAASGEPEVNVHGAQFRKVCGSWRFVSGAMLLMVSPETNHVLDALVEARAERDAWQAKAEGYSDIVARGAKHWLDLQDTHQIAWEGALDGAMAAACTEIKSLAAKWEDAERRLDDEKALRFEATRPVARRLREVFGVRYIPKDPLPWVLHDTHRFRTLSGLIDSAEGSAAGLSDNSHKFLLSLESEPYEKVEDRLRDVIVKQLDYIGNSNIFKLVDAIRAEFPHIDEPQEPDLEQTLRTWLAQQPAPGLTAAQHVEALVGMGAKQYSNIADDEMRFVGRRDLVLLPREANP
jgi:hypothetical protein